MTLDQIEHVRNLGTVASIITTRNAVYVTVDQYGAPGPGARYNIVEWKDDLELVVLQNMSQPRPGQPMPLTYVNYGIIDEMQSLPV